jgi:predicted nucleotidyltransferase
VRRRGGQEAAAGGVSSRPSDCSSPRAPAQAALDRLVERIVEAVHPLRIVLFGSAARGDMGASSDLDLLVVMPDGTHRRRTTQRLYRCVKGIGVPFDILVTTPSFLERHRQNPGLVYRTILEEGKTVYGG